MKLHAVKSNAVLVTFTFYLSQQPSFMIVTDVLTISSPEIKIPPKRSGGCNGENGRTFCDGALRASLNPCTSDVL